MQPAIDRRDFMKLGLATGAIAALPELIIADQAGLPEHPEFEQPFRQIHLDFHTSRYIDGVGDLFDPDEFAETLRKRTSTQSIALAAVTTVSSIGIPKRSQNVGIRR